MASLKIQKIQQKLNQQKNKIGLVGGTIKIKEYDETENYISACISPDNWNIEISMRKGFDPIKDRRQRAYTRKKTIVDCLEKLLTDVSTHEFAHWELPYNSERGCPYNTYWDDKILEAVKNELPDNKKAHADYVTSAFEDLIINPRCREWKGDFSGQVLFWDWEGISCKEKRQQHYTDFYEAFVKLNMHLFGDNVDRALLKRHYSNNEKVEEAVKKTIETLNLPENIQDTSILFEKGNWPEMVRIFTRNLADLLDESPTERLSAFSDNGKQGESSGNVIEKKSRTKEGKEEIAYGRYSSGDKQSTNLTSYEQLDALYRKLARAIPIHIEAIARNQNLDIAPLTFRPFDEEKDELAKIKFSKLFLTDKGLEFAYQNQPLSIQEKSKFQRRSFPDFKMIVGDNSGTMESAPDGSNNVGSQTYIPWGDNSRYHYFLLGRYGIENFLQRQGISQYIGHGLYMYSSSVRYRETDFQNLNKQLEYLFSPEFGSTVLDANTLIKALSGKESFVLSISDGDIHNWNSQKNQIKKLLDRKDIYFAHVQLGPETNFSRDIDSWGFSVYPVSSGKDLTRLMIGTTLNTYHKFTRGENNQK